LRYPAIRAYILLTEALVSKEGVAMVAISGKTVVATGDRRGLGTALIDEVIGRPVGPCRKSAFSLAD
jgi:hypothetical protein